MSARLTRIVDVRRLEGEKTLTIEATEAERVAIAEALDLVAVEGLRADLAVRPWRGEGCRVTGTVHGEVRQTCVVTLEPVAGTVDETIDVRLHPDAAPRSVVDVDPAAEDPPEPLEGTRLDVGAVALEHFVLGLDPYPRAPGAQFEATPEEPEPSPFAALAALRPRGKS